MLFGIRNTFFTLLSSVTWKAQFEFLIRSLKRYVSIIDWRRRENNYIMLQRTGTRRAWTCLWLLFKKCSLDMNHIRPSTWRPWMIKQPHPPVLSCLHVSFSATPSEQDFSQDAGRKSELTSDWEIFTWRTWERPTWCSRSKGRRR